MPGAETIMTLAGILCIRNGDTLDYCWREAARSLLEVCDELVICDCDSTDGTREVVDQWASKNPKINVCNYPWTNPTATNLWWPEFQNYSRQHAKSQMGIYLDADELIHEKDHHAIRESANAGRILFFHRYNFWRDPKSLIPEGVCCGTKVLRMAPINMPICSDYPYEPANSTIAQAVDSGIEVFHYGFLRRREAFFKKAREVQRIWVGNFDPRLEAAESFYGPWSTMPGVTGWEDKLTAFHGTHPKIIHPWLKERGYAPL